MIDLSAIISGPMATQILADQGADVIKEYCEDNLNDKSHPSIMKYTTSP